MSGQLEPNPTRRYGCVVCRSRKLTNQFPLAEDGERILVTCSDCSGNQIGGNRRAVPGEVEDEDAEEVAAGGAIPGVAATTVARKRKRRSKEDYPLRKKAKQSALPAVPRKSRVVTCSICIEDKLIREFPKGPSKAYQTQFRWYYPLGDVPSGCAVHLTINRHNRGGAVCKECIGASLVASIDLKGPERIGCPKGDCDKVWDTTDYVAKYLSTDDFSAFSEKLFDTWRKTNKDLKQCVNQECGVTVLLDATTTNGYPHVSGLHFCDSIAIFS